MNNKKQLQILKAVAEENGISVTLAYGGYSVVGDTCRGVVPTLKMVAKFLSEVTGKQVPLPA